jgi:hypothetical protein
MPPLEQALDQHFAERPPLDAPDDVAEHVGRVAVVEPVAGRVEQRQGRQRAHPIVGRPVVGEQIAERRLVGVGDRTHRAERVGQARAVGDEVVDGDVARRRIGVVQRAAGVLQHPHAGELGRPLGDRVLELELAFLHQLQRHDAGDRLGHGGDAEDGVARHRRARLDVALADGVELQLLAVLPDQRHRPGKPAGVDHAAQRRLDRAQRRPVEALYATRIIHRFLIVASAPRLTV